MRDAESPKKTNPQGKGLIPVLDSIVASRAVVEVPAKHIEQISIELFTSLFVLNSQFQFKPVVGKPYWLFRNGGIFKLSLISPEEWRGGFGQYVGECRLQSDITWTLKLDEQAAMDSELMQIIAQKREQFEARLQAAECVDQVLPIFDASLPFYQRVFASALAHSLGGSMQKSGIKRLSYAQAKKLFSRGTGTISKNVLTNLIP